MVTKYDFIDYSENTNSSLINIKTCEKLDENIINRLQLIANGKIIQLYPILPILSSKTINVPYESTEQMLNVGRKPRILSLNSVPLSPLAIASSMISTIFLIRICKEYIKTWLLCNEVFKY